MAKILGKSEKQKAAKIFEKQQKMKNKENGLSEIIEITRLSRDEIKKL